MTALAPKDIVSQIWWAGVNAVIGDVAVATALSEKPIEAPDRIIAVGKAAIPMAMAALDRFGAEIPALALTKYSHSEWLKKEGRLRPSTLEIHESGHPIVDENSLISGERFLAAVEGMRDGQSLLLLVSGGASALVEVPVTGLSLKALQQKNHALLASGLDIHAINAQRKQLSQIKGGKLLSRFGGKRVDVLAVSDVQGDEIAIIGSGLGDAPTECKFEYRSRIVASNATARNASAEYARALGLEVLGKTETLYGDVNDVATRIGQAIKVQRPGIAIYGGEPTVELPDDPGQGGRNQALALALAREISGVKDVCVLVAGTDGTDGPTEAAGGIIDGATWQSHPGGTEALLQADSGSWLETANCRFVTGPTGTNVMDLLVVLRF